MIGTPSKLYVQVSRKLGDEAYGSYGVEAALEVNLPADANLEESFDGLDAWLTSAVGKSMAEKKAVIQKQQAETVAQAAQHPPIVQQAPTPVPATPPPAPSAAQEPTRVPVDDSGAEALVVPISGIAHSMTMNGDHICKVFGKVEGHNLELFGVTCWPEVLKLAEVYGWEDWPICKGSKDGFSKENRFQMPNGYTKMVVQMGPNKAGKIVPQRVWRFER